MRPRQKALPLIVQLLHLQRLHPEGHGQVERHLGPPQLRWTQWIRPDPLGMWYRLKLRYALGTSPRPLIVEPNLFQLADGRPLPHVFEPINGHPHLCLKVAGDWRPWQRLSSTYVIWSAEWLWFFEHWLQRDEWLGGGTHAVSPSRAVLESVTPAA